MTVLTELIAALDRGTLKVVDLTQPLGPDTPVIGLPPMFAPSPGVSMEVISRYDDKGPAWYWNTLRFGGSRERTCLTTGATRSRRGGSSARRA